MSGDWWKEEEAVFGGDNDEEFEWFQGGDNNGATDQSGVGDDGGAFGFGNDDDFEDEEKEEDLDADSWMTSITVMDNVLDGSIQKKDPNKRNTKGATMSSMAKKNGSKQPIPNSFGTDDFFNNNSGNNDNNDFDPFGLENNSNSASNNITDLYNQKNNGMFNGNNSNFGYQGKSNILRMLMIHLLELVQLREVLSPQNMYQERKKMIHFLNLVD